MDVETSFDVTVAAANDAPGLAATAAVAVTPVNGGPTAGHVTLVVDEGQSVSMIAEGTTSLLAVARDADGDLLRAVLVSAPQAGSRILHQDGSFQYTHDGS